MAFAFNGETSLLQKNCLEDKIVPEIKSNILAEIQYVNKCNTSLMKLSLTIIFFCITFALKGKIPLLKNDVCFVLLFHSYERAYCIHATMYLPKSIIYIHFYFTIMILVHFCKCFSQLVHSLIKVYRKLCAYWHQHVLSGTHIH